MEDELLTLDKKALVQMVKESQARRMIGKKGGWKSFLNSYDDEAGEHISDPGRRDAPCLIAFLKTFNWNDLKYLKKLSTYAVAKQLAKQEIADTETAELRLVRQTMEHPLYPTEYSFPSREEGWLVIKCKTRLNSLNSVQMTAIDCVMVLCQDGTEALAGVSAVDHNFKVKLDELVCPGKEIADYRTDITGIDAKGLEGITTSLLDVQKSLRKLLEHRPILVGHNLNKALLALKLDYSRVIDTSYLFTNENELPNKRPSLSKLCKSVLGFKLREKGLPRNCQDDAIAAMKLTLAKIKKEKYRIVQLPQLDSCSSHLKKSYAQDEMDPSKLQKLMMAQTNGVPEDTNTGSKSCSGHLKKSCAKDEVDKSELKKFGIAQTNGDPEDTNTGSKSCSGHLKKRCAKDEVDKSELKKLGTAQTNGVPEDTNTGSKSCSGHLKKSCAKDEIDKSELKKLGIAQTNGVPEDTNTGSKSCSSHLKKSSAKDETDKSELKKLGIAQTNGVPEDTNTGSKSGSGHVRERSARDEMDVSGVKKLRIAQTNEDSTETNTGLDSCIGNLKKSSAQDEMDPSGLKKLGIAQTTADPEGTNTGSKTCIGHLKKSSAQDEMDPSKLKKLGIAQTNGVPEDTNTGSKSCIGNLKKRSAQDEMDTSELKKLCVAQTNGDSEETNAGFDTCIGDLKKSCAQDEMDPSGLKKLQIAQTNGYPGETKTGSESCSDHLKEIEKLRKKLAEKENENIHLSQIIVALTSKQGL